jgi:hypothetical protein
VARPDRLNDCGDGDAILATKTYSVEAPPDDTETAEEVRWLQVLDKHDLGYDAVPEYAFQQTLSVIGVRRTMAVLHDIRAATLDSLGRWRAHRPVAPKKRPQLGGDQAEAVFHPGNLGGNRATGRSTAAPSYKAETPSVTTATGNRSER